MSETKTETQQQPTTDQTEEPKPVARMTAAEVAMEGRKLATSYLERRGYAVLERDWRCAAGEVDAVADDEGAPVLVLVRTARRLALLWLAVHPEAEGGPHEHEDGRALVLGHGVDLPRGAPPAALEDGVAAPLEVCFASM